MSNKPIWATVIQERRKALYKSAAEAARVAGFNRSTMAVIENGYQDPRKILPESQLGLLRALKWTHDEFFAATGLELPVVAPTVRESIKSYESPPDHLHHPMWIDVIGVGHSERLPWQTAMEQFLGDGSTSTDTIYIDTTGDYYFIARDAVPRLMDVVAVEIEGKINVMRYVGEPAGKLSLAPVDNLRGLAEYDPGLVRVLGVATSKITKNIN